MDSPGRAVVIGGGVIGAACGYYLLRDGWKVTLVDRGAFGRGCSHANCGYVCPSHVLPMAGPGAVWEGLKALLAPNAPLTIRPRLDPALWGWLLRFVRRCNRRQALEAGRGIQALLASSRRLYEELLRDEAIECEWEARGLLIVFRSAAAFEHYGETAELLDREFGVRATRLSAERLTEREPALRPALPGAWLYEGDAHLRPDRLMAELRRVLLSRGAEILEHTDASGVAREGGRARAVIVKGGEIEADAFVLATGALAPAWRRELGCVVPIQPGKGYSITMPRPERCPSFPMIFEEDRVAVTPFRSGYRLGSTMEFAGYDSSLDPRRLELLTNAARLYLHEPGAEPVEEQWFGWRPMTPDGLPMIGRSPALPNLWIAAGHNMLGLSMAPATGRLVSELLSGRPPHIDAAPYSVTRFR
jgi:D-amino-acid dehydrogenase